MTSSSQSPSSTETSGISEITSSAASGGASGNVASFAGQQPFAIQYDEHIAELLYEIGATILLSSSQVGKLILISSDGKQISQLVRSFQRPRGLALRDQYLAIANERQVTVTRNSPQLARLYPKRPNTYDALFCPVVSYYTSALDMHDLCWAGEELIGVNTKFSCLCRVDQGYHFSPVWKPPYITELQAIDSCHLNGIAVVDGKPRYVTALGQGDEPGAWRKNKYAGGVLLDVQSNEILLDNLATPHSPRYHEGALYFLLSASGEVVRYQPQARELKVLNTLPGFLRGLGFCDQYMFVGLSRYRKNDRNVFGDFPRDPEKLHCGITILHKQSGSVMGSIRYLNLCEEIYDIQLLPDMRRPNILSIEDELASKALTYPNGYFWVLEAEEAEAVSKKVS